MKSFNRNFNLMVIGQIISLFGASILKFSISLYILDLTGSAETFAGILAISSIPTIFLSPIGGAIADRYNRRNLMVIFDFTSCFIVFIFMLNLFSGNSSTILIGAIVTLLSIISILYQPTVQASIPSLVECDQLMKANGITSGVSAVTNFAGPILGGLLYSAIGLKYIVVISCISFFLSAVMEIFIRIPFEKAAKNGFALTAIVSDIKDGVRYIFKENIFVVKIMGIACILNIFITPFFLVGLPYIVKITFQMKDEFLGFTQGGLSISMIVGAIAIGSLSKKLTQKNTYILFIYTAVIFLLTALSVSTFIHSNWIQYILFTLSALLIMFFITLVNIFIITIVQKQTPSSYIGKVMSILLAVSSCAVPLGQMIFGILFERLPEQLSVIVLGIAFVVMITAIATKQLFKNDSAALVTDNA